MTCLAVGLATSHGGSHGFSSVGIESLQESGAYLAGACQPAGCRPQAAGPGGYTDVLLGLEIGYAVFLGCDRILTAGTAPARLAGPRLGWIGWRVRCWPPPTARTRRRSRGRACPGP